MDCASIAPTTFRLRRRNVGAAIVLFAAVTGCELDSMFSGGNGGGDDDPSGPAAVEFMVQPIDGQVNEPLEPPPQIVITDSAGNPDTTFSGTVTIALHDEGPDANLVGKTTREAQRGVVVFADLEIDEPGSNYRLMARVTGIPAVTSSPFDVRDSDDDDDGTADPVALARVSGHGQTGVVGRPLAAPYILRVTDASGDPVAGVVVTWAVSAGGGSVNPGSSVTNASGLASTTHTLGTGVGAHAVRATVGAIAPLTFSATAIAAPAERLAFTVQPTNTAVGAAIAPAVQVTARDQYGNPATSFVGAVTVTQSGGPGGNSLGGITTRIATAGVATFPGLTFSRTGRFRLDANSPALTEGRSNAFDIRAADDDDDDLTAVALVSGNAQGGIVGQPLVAPYVVRVTNAGGGPVQGVVVTWAITAGGGSVNPVSSTTDATGHASATHALGTGAGAHSVRATVSGLPPVDFTATAAAAAPMALAFATQPSNSGFGRTITPAVRVTVRDQYGNTVTGFSGAITMSIMPATGTAGAALSGTLAQPVTNGVATFTDLNINLIGVSYRLRATGGGLTADSAPFTVLL